MTDFAIDHSATLLTVLLSNVEMSIHAVNSHVCRKVNAVREEPLADIGQADGGSTGL